MELRGLEGLQARLEAVRRAACQGASAGVAEVAEDIAACARSLAPVSTGALRDSIVTGTTLTADGAAGEVRAGAPYAASVEFGGDHGPPRPFLSPAYQAQRDQAAQAVCDAVRQAL